MNLNQQIEEWLASARADHQPRQRPFVTLTYAQSWDGSITHRVGESLSLSGETSLQLTHQLRSLHDAILVGVGTVLVDNPRLTVRAWQGPNPRPVILDSKLRTPLAAHVLRHPNHQPWIFTCTPEKQERSGRARLFTLPPDDNGRVPLTPALEVLWQQGVTMLMVEGGARVITSMLKAGLADALILTIAPRLVGGQMATGNLDLEGYLVDRLPRVSPLHSAMLDPDLVVWGMLHYGGEIQ